MWYIEEMGETMEEENDALCLVCRMLHETGC